MSTEVSVVDDVIEVVIVDDVIEILFASEQGPAGAGLKRIDVPALVPSTPTVVDTVSASTIASAKWLISAKQTISGLFGFREVTSDLDSDFVVSHAMRDVAFDVDVNLVSGNLELEVVNNEAVDIDLKIIRLAI